MLMKVSIASMFPSMRRCCQTVLVHFPKTNPLSEEAAGYVSAVASRFCECYLMDDGTADSRLCFVLDLASAQLYPGVQSVRQRLKDAEAACEQIFDLWDTIKEA
jgi:hypothetical protein